MNVNVETRYEQWVQTSHGLLHIERFLIQVLQGLGHLDCQLITEDERFLQLPDKERSTIPEMLLLTDRYTLSYLWVLGAYELVRTLDQKCRINSSLLNYSLNNSINNLKHQIERLRIPLAKMEPASRHPTDSPIAFPAISQESGVAWQLAPEVFIARRDLSDGLLKLVTDIDEFVST